MRIRQGGRATSLLGLEFPLRVISLLRRVIEEGGLLGGFDFSVLFQFFFFFFLLLVGLLLMFFVSKGLRIFVFVWCF